MPDINLLADRTTTGNDDRKDRQRPAPPKIEYSTPEQRVTEPSPLRRPSAFMLWAKSLFRRSPGKKAAASVPPLPKPRPVASSPSKVPVGSQPEDIFAGIGGTRGGPRPKTKPSNDGSTPSGARPGDFPPLPNPPSWAVSTKPGSVAEPPRFTPPPRTANVSPGFVAGPAPSGPTGRLGRPQLPPRPTSRRSFLGKDDEAPFSGVNLLPEDLVTSFEPRQKFITLGLTVLATVLVIGIAYVGLLVFRETQVKKTHEVEAKVAEITTKINSLEPDQKNALRFKAKNDIIRQLLNRHVYWTQFLAAFEEATLSTVFYPTGITADTTSAALSLTGTAPSIAVVNEQLKAYAEATKLVQAVKIDSIKIDQESGFGYSFFVDFIFNPGIYYRPIDDSAGSPSAP